MMEWKEVVRLSAVCRILVGKKVKIGADEQEVSSHDPFRERIL